MCRFIETVKLENGIYKLIDYHNKRLNNTIINFFKKNPLKSELIDIAKFLPSPAAAEFKKGIFKCRVVYSNKIESIEILPYIKKNIRRLKLVESNIDYSLKFENRDSINNLFNGLKFFKDKNHLNSFTNLSANLPFKAHRNSFDSDYSDFDILIVKKGLITDTSYSNIILYDGKEWITPKSFLLNGVKRRYLLNNGIIREMNICLDDLKNFKKLSLINAMLEPRDIEIDIDNII
jgi:4-amino-4-deoxychorismate lyase